MKGYIYSIINKVNGKRYVGQTIDLERRKQTHFNKFNKNTHPNYLLQKDWNDWGEENFLFEYEEFEIKKREDLNQKEIDTIKLYNSFGKNGYNLTGGGQGGIIKRTLTYEQFCFIYYGCQWQGLTEKIAQYLQIDSSIVSAVLREKSHLDYLEKSKEELRDEDIKKIREDFCNKMNISILKEPDENRVPSHLTEDEYYYCFCIASSYGRGIETALSKYFNKHKSFLSNGLKSAKNQGKVKRAYDRFIVLSEEDIIEIGIQKFKEWDIQSFSNRIIEQQLNLKWRQ